VTVAARTVARLAILVSLAAALAACGAPPAASATLTPETVTTVPRSPEVTKPVTAQTPLPLPTTVRWAVDNGSPDDPQHRSLLVLLYDGTARVWTIVDASGAGVFRVPIAGSGIFGPESCVVKARRPNEVATWIALDEPSLERFAQRYRSYRATAEGVPTGSATLELVDSGCRAM
jgi:hypothetical protein